MRSSNPYLALPHDPAVVADTALDLIRYWANVTHAFWIGGIDAPIDVDDVKRAERQLNLFLNAFEDVRFVKA